MPNIKGWVGPKPRPGTDYVCYQKRVGPKIEQDANEMKFDIQSITEQFVQPKMLFIKIKDTSISGGMRCFGPSWEIVLESGKWMRYDLDLTLTPTGDIAIKNGELKLTRRRAGTTLDIDIETIQDMATWLDGQF